MLDAIELWRTREVVDEWRDLFILGRDHDDFRAFVSGAATGAATLAPAHRAAEVVVSFGPMARYLEREARRIVRRTRAALAFTFGEEWRRGIP